ncbi:MAG: AtpZ/AtpI family protein [Magnetococcales bacterium]|nr:AtpZ/AtpI family protein [Magnetococcales bacterium]
MQPHSGMSLALRLGVELVTAVLIGVAIGYMLDRFFASTPWMIALFSLFGVIAGFRNMYRAASSIPPMP